MTYTGSEIVHDPVVEAVNPELDLTPPEEEEDEDAKLIVALQAQINAAEVRIATKKATNKLRCEYDTWQKERSEMAHCLSRTCGSYVWTPCFW